MLELGTKVSAVMLLLCLLFSCKENKHKEAIRKRSLYKQYSMKQVGAKEYEYVWNAARDSIQLWADNRLGFYSLYVDNKWYLDSLVCFNREMDRCMMALSYQSDRWSPSDGMDYFHGAKVKGKWYFFFGSGHYVLPRDYYQSDVRVPLNIEQFNEIAVDNIFKGYLKKDKDGVWQINEAFFTYHFEGVGWGDFNKQSHKDTAAYGKRFTNKKEYYESIYLRGLNDKWIKEEKKDNALLH